MNNFFFEEKYYLGKNVDYYLCPIQWVDTQYYNLSFLQKKQEYSFGLLYTAYFDTVEKPQHKIPKVEYWHSYNSFSEPIASFFYYYEHYFSKLPTTGMRALATALMLGYRTIYITGIDFFETQAHAYKNEGELFTHLHSIYFECLQNDPQKIFESHHSSDMEREFLRLIIQHKLANIYALSPDSPLAEILPLAPVLDVHFSGVEEKPSDAMRDWVLSPLKIEEEQLKIQHEEQLKIQHEEQLKIEKEQQLDIEKEQQLKILKGGVFYKIKVFFIKQGLQDDWNKLRSNMVLLGLTRILKLGIHTLKAPLLIFRFTFKLIGLLFSNKK